MFQMLARKQTHRPRAMSSSGVAFTTSSPMARTLLSGSTKNIARPRAGSLPSAAKRGRADRPPSRTSATSGERAPPPRDGSARRSNLQHAAPPAAAAGSPATSRPSIRRSARAVASRAEIAGDSRPLAMTTSLSLISKSSSSSSLTTRSAHPSSRSATSSPRICADAPTSTPHVGCDTTSTLRLRVDPASHDELLQVAAREAARRRVGARAP